MTLTDFLLARISEDEERVRRQNRSDLGIDWRSEPTSGARVLAECDAKRRIVRRSQAAEAALTGPMDDSTYFIRRACRDSWRLALADLALPYADHSDYQPEWKP